MTPSHFVPINDLIWGMDRMVSGAVHTSTRAPARVSRCSHLSPGSGLVTRTRWAPDSLWICMGVCVWWEGGLWVWVFFFSRRERVSWPTNAKRGGAVCPLARRRPHSARHEPLLSTFYPTHFHGQAAHGTGGASHRAALVRGRARGHGRGRGGEGASQQANGGAQHVLKKGGGGEGSRGRDAKRERAVCERCVREKSPTQERAAVPSLPCPPQKPSDTPLSSPRVAPRKKSSNIKEWTPPSPSLSQPLSLPHALSRTINFPTDHTTTTCFLFPPSPLTPAPRTAWGSSWPCPPST